MTIPREHSLEFERLLEPVSVETFLRDYWEERYLLLDGRPADRHRDVFSFRDVDRYLAVAARQQGERISMSKDGKKRPTVLASAISTRELFGAVADGWTVKLVEIDRCWPAAAVLADTLGTALSARVEVNAYLSPPGHQGAPIHPDTEEVFALQVEGRKMWDIYQRRIYQPLETLDHRFRAFKPPKDPVTQDSRVEASFVMEPGDLLYIPRGVVHRAAAPTDSPSLHVCAEVTPFSWVDFMKAAVESVSAESPEFARALPPGFERDPSLHEAMAARFGQLLARFNDRASFADTNRLMVAATRSRRRPREGQFEQVLRLAEIDLDSVLERRPDQTYGVESDDDSATLRSDVGEVRAPRVLKPVLEWIQERSRLRPRDIPGGLNDQSKLVLVRRLVRQGLFEVDWKVKGASGSPGDGDGVARESHAES